MLVLRISDLPSIIWKIKIFHVRYEFMYIHIKKYYEKKSKQKIDQKTMKKALHD